jgi:hypothetical protein
MEIPWPKWMEFVIAGISLVISAVTVIVIDLFQKPPDG